MQIFPEYVDCSVFRFLRQFISYLPFDRRLDQTFITVLDNFFLRPKSYTDYHLQSSFSLNISEYLPPGLYFDRQYFFFLTAVQRKNPMSGKLFNRFFKFVIHLVNRFCLRIFCCRNDFSFFHRRFSDPCTIIRIIGNDFRNNVFCSGDCFFLCLYFFSSEIYCFAVSSKGSFACCSIIYAAKGSNPFLSRSLPSSAASDDMADTDLPLSRASQLKGSSL